MRAPKRCWREAGWRKCGGWWQSGLPENAKPFDFIGYRELREVLRGEMKLEEARAAIQQATRRYAKRQMTWFRREKGVHWLAGFGDDPRIQEEALESRPGRLGGGSQGNGRRIMECDEEFPPRAQVSAHDGFGLTSMKTAQHDTSVSERALLVGCGLEARATLSGHAGRRARPRIASGACGTGAKRRSGNCRHGFSGARSGGPGNAGGTGQTG